MPTGSFIWGCFEATLELKLVIVTLFVQQQLQPQQASSPHGWLKHLEGGHLIVVTDTSNAHRHFKAQVSY